MANKQMAIIKDVGIGMRDVNEPILWFTIHVTESMASLQVFRWEAAAEVIKAYHAYDVKHLEGRSCWVEVGSSYMKYLGPCIIK